MLILDAPHTASILVFMGSIVRIFLRHAHFSSPQTAISPALIMLFRLSKAYGGRARDVLEINRIELGATQREGKLIPGMPYLDAEVRHQSKDFL